MQIKATENALYETIGRLYVEGLALRQNAAAQDEQLAEKDKELATLRDTCDKLASQLPSAP